MPFFLLTLRHEGCPSKNNRATPFHEARPTLSQEKTPKIDRGKKWSYEDEKLTKAELIWDVFQPEGLKNLVLVRK